MVSKSIFHPLRTGQRKIKYFISEWHNILNRDICKIRTKPSEAEA
jgi:hypothetical protein